MNDYEFARNNPGFSAVAVLLIVIFILFRENQAVKRKLLKASELYNEALKVRDEALSRLSGMEERAGKGSRDRHTESDFPEPVESSSRQDWACAVLDLDPDKPRFSRREVHEARRKAIKRLHPDSGGSGLIGQPDMAVSILESRTDEA